MAKTNSKDALVNKAKALFNYARTSEQYSKWFTESQESYNLYEGNHWTDEEIRILQDRGQAPVVVNKFAPKIDALSGVEVQQRTTVTYRARNQAQSSRDIALAYSYLATYIQDQNDTAYSHSASFKDALIGGIGWMEVDYDGYCAITQEVDPYEMMWDVDDMSKDMSNQQYCIRFKWMALEQAKQRFPSMKSDLENMAVNGSNSTVAGMASFGTIPESGVYTTVASPGFSYYDKENKRVCIIEVHYKELQTVYKTRTTNDIYATFMTEKDARKNKGKQAKVEEVEELVNKYIYYTDQTLLDNGTSVVQGPFFSYIPMLFKRGRLDKVPYGLGRAAKYPQYEYNKRRSKALHLLNTVRVVADANAVESITDLRMELARPDSIIFKKPQHELDIKDNVQMEGAQVQLMQISTQEMAETTGVYDELLGAPGNTVSGVAQVKKQESSVRTHATAFSLLSLAKKRFGQALIYVLNAAYKDETYIPIMADDKLVKIIKLNAETPDGEILNSTAGIMFDVYVEEIPETSALPEEESERLTQILMNGQGQMLAVPEIAEKLGFRDPEGISSAVRKLFTSSQPQQAGGATPPPGGIPGNAPSLPSQQ